MYTDIKEDFRAWLIEDKGLSAKAAGDVLCRCKRLDSGILSANIDIAISTPKDYLQALQDVGQYASVNRSSKTSIYSMAGVLRSALRKYCEFCNPDSFAYYPTAHSIPRDLA